MHVTTFCFPVLKILITAYSSFSFYSHLLPARRGRILVVILSVADSSSGLASMLNASTLSTDEYFCFLDIETPILYFPLASASFVSSISSKGPSQIIISFSSNSFQKSFLASFSSPCHFSFSVLYSHTLYPPPDDHRSTVYDESFRVPLSTATLMSILFFLSSTNLISPCLPTNDWSRKKIN